MRSWRRRRLRRRRRTTAESGPVHAPPARRSDRPKAPACSTTAPGGRGRSMIRPPAEQVGRQGGPGRDRRRAIRQMMTDCGDDACCARGLGDPFGGECAPGQAASRRTMRRPRGAPVPRRGHEHAGAHIHTPHPAMYSKGSPGPKPLRRPSFRQRTLRLPPPDRSPRRAVRSEVRRDGARRTRQRRRLPQTPLCSDPRFISPGLATGLGVPSLAADTRPPFWVDLTPT